MFPYIELCIDNLVDKTLRDFKEYRSRIRISRLKTQFAVIRFEAKHEGDRTNVNIPGYDVNSVTRSSIPPSVRARVYEKRARFQN